MTVALNEIRECLEGAVPSVIATADPHGVTNVAYLSQVHFVDDGHVALSYQFFNKTRENILANPRAAVQVVDPRNAAHFRLHLQYLRTETEGPLFENMKAKLAGIASHTGMSKVFRLLGADIYRVLAVECVQGSVPVPGTPQPPRLQNLRACQARLAGCGDLASLFDTVLESLAQYCHYPHAMLLMFDATHQRLYTVASHGYAESGVGSEIGLGEGIIGVAARERTPIRIGYAASEYQYSRALREGFANSAGSQSLETAIPFPGLAESGSQLAVPVTFGARLLGVLYVESAQELRFTYEDEDALVILAGQLALAIELLAHGAEQHGESAGAAALVPSPVMEGAALVIRHFAADHSVFLDNDYLIKGVAGAIFWKLVRDYLESGRSEFTNRELRLDPAFKLPDITDNLEARLILLQRRLAERSPFLSIEKTGRGRFRLNVTRPLAICES